jgi:hypothetical protein
MREGYLIADGEPVGLVCLAVHYKNGGMFMAHDVNRMLPSPVSKRARVACLPVVNDFLLAISMHDPPIPAGTVRAGGSLHRFRTRRRQK